MTKGGCLCGKIVYEILDEPVKTVLCHCINCKRMTGSSYSTNISVRSSSLRFVGSPRKFLLKSGQGPVFTVSFCDTCSSTLWKESESEGYKGYTIVQAGTLAQGLDRYPPEGEIFVRERVMWMGQMENVEQFEGTDVRL
ncbi:hypothetical protein DPSP01_012532 [Paraphaeosphaeria sporulosa]|uniref:CENP-V/GFA domain-containing protein n=1 Tax=Paraphaeosphaeria sporulosa TaxID=1460663 RepID=A0A177BY85_9PLEO|nr:uncharacterized protein CC84DRAFT_1104265 [Paraphaeosphaeria sporulosa]OAF99366.1 hypothetical protein CC84DRAFT_1104265 [Paraphaeosphaeria sporulosa]